MAYANYFNEFDWFVKGDDDSYFIIENLRYMLHQYNPQTAMIIGHKIVDSSTKDGYMSGCGYILSKKALEKFVHQVLDGKCEPGIKGAEDLLVGKCLQEEVLFIDAHDDKYEKQIFPVNIEQNFIENLKDIDKWYVESQWAKFYHGNFSCCSEELVSLHYKKPPEMYLIDYLVYHVHAFGHVGNYNTGLPKKLTFEETLKAANEKSLSIKFVDHHIEHNFDENEIF
ncbi:glycoprotein-N-acetylgalactosamine 3-beta-galactosyltransferase 1-like [Chironomus tepperi]|uniref:glycoprotein-N-acetylgalactosamine 3-beta-galactosyltransferase 1-like n=1 Tax=Chironomus tepperi TaxID=113505 RepID=UPI00391EEACD